MENLPIRERLFSDDPIRGSVVFAMNELAKKGFTYDDMTISQICKEAGVSRSTFYRYFEDKLEAAMWAMRRVSEVGIGNVGRTLGWRDGIGMTLAATEYLAPFFQAGGKCENKCYSAITGDFASYHKDIFEETITRYKRERLDEELEFVLQFWIYSLTESLNYWRINEFNPPSDMMVECIERAIPPEIYDLLKTPVNAPLPS